MDCTCHVHKLLVYNKHKYYEFGNKSSRLLADESKNLINDRSINMIRSQNRQDTSSLDAAFTPEEVRAAIQSMRNGKCLGPDGFPLKFFFFFFVEVLGRD